MGKKGNARPGGGRPPGRRGKAGVGPGPGYRPGNPRGNKAKGGASGVATPPIVGIAFAIFIAVPVLVAAGIITFIARGAAG